VSRTPLLDKDAINGWTLSLVVVKGILETAFSTERLLFDNPFVSNFTSGELRFLVFDFLVRWSRWSW
jgi:hypothetical protein